MKKKDWQYSYNIYKSNNTKLWEKLTLDMEHKHISSINRIIRTEIVNKSIVTFIFLAYRSTRFFVGESLRLAWKYFFRWTIQTWIWLWHGDRSRRNRTDIWHQLGWTCVGKHFYIGRFLVRCVYVSLVRRFHVRCFYVRYFYLRCFYIKRFYVGRFYERFWNIFSI